MKIVQLYKELGDTLAIVVDDANLIANDISFREVTDDVALEIMKHECENFCNQLRILLQIKRHYYDQEAVNRGETP